MTVSPPAIHPILAVLRELVPSLAKVLGEDAEVVLHELSHPQDSVIAIEGNLTGRKAGAPLTDLVLRLMRQGKLEEDLINYPSRTSDGKELRSSTILIRDEKGEVIGCLCINFDLTKWIVTKHTVDSFCRTELLDDEVSETFTEDVESMLRSKIDEVIEQQGAPVTLMKKEDKLRAVKQLDEQGIFLIRRSVARVAKALGVSRYTIYNYLDEIRS
jgi:predicted transcriptional regulator YheO